MPSSFVYGEPLMNFRWLIKKDGTKVLQQQWYIKPDMKYIWVNVSEVTEEEAENEI